MAFPELRNQVVKNGFIDSDKKYNRPDSPVIELAKPSLNIHTVVERKGNRIAISRRFFIGNKGLKKLNVFHAAK